MNRLRKANGHASAWPFGLWPHRRGSSNAQARSGESVFDGFDRTRTNRLARGFGRERHRLLREGVDPLTRLGRRALDNTELGETRQREDARLLQFTVPDRDQRFDDRLDLLARNLFARSFRNRLHQRALAQRLLRSGTGSSCRSLLGRHVQIPPTYCIARDPSPRALLDATIHAARDKKSEIQLGNGDCRLRPWALDASKSCTTHSAAPKNVVISPGNRPQFVLHKNDADHCRGGVGFGEPARNVPFTLENEPDQPPASSAARLRATSSVESSANALSTRSRALPRSPCETARRPRW